MRKFEKLCVMTMKDGKDFENKNKCYQLKT